MSKVDCIDLKVDSLVQAHVHLRPEDQVQRKVEETIDEESTESVHL
jgi:hypothetical protein